MSERLQPLSLESPAVAALEFLMANHFQEEEVRKFLAERKVAESYSYEDLAEFLNSQLFKKRFQKYWKYETSEQWEGRSAKEALRETGLHALTGIACNAQLFLYRGDKKKFPGQSDEEIERINAQALLLGRYFYEKL